MIKFQTREEWLTEGIKALAPIFSQVGETLPTVKVSVGWPGGRGKKNSVIGQCWSPSVAKDEVSHIFISPVLDDASRVLDVLAHELVHAINFAEGDACGHKGRFAKIAKAIGLEGKMTATVAGEGLKDCLDKIAEDLGEFPHGALTTADGGADGPKKQGTRMLKVVCAETEGEEGYTVRTTRKWLDAYGTPSCPCHGEPMIEVMPI